MFVGLSMASRIMPKLEGPRALLLSAEAVVLKGHGAIAVP